VRLADLQADIATAVVENANPVSASVLTGGDNPTSRFAIHGRHYTASLARSVVERFAATAWLAGSEFVTQVATRFVCEHPPVRPCLAEYGDRFPAYLMSFGGTTLPYLEQFATVDWHLGRLAIAVDTSPRHTLANCGPACLAEAPVTLQPGVEYVALDWPLDELIQFYLSGDPPDQYKLRNEAVCVELRGSRGELWFTRLTKGHYEFRRGLANGVTLRRAAELATRNDESFDPGSALLAMLDAGLVTGLSHAKGGES
jgi:hypothetical protein